MALMLENASTADTTFTDAEISELNSPVEAIEVRGAGVPDGVLAFRGGSGKSDSGISGFCA